VVVFDGGPYTNIILPGFPEVYDPEPPLPELLVVG
jgi:hypothetical protein